MMKKFVFLMILLFFLLSQNGFSAVTSGADFLKLPRSARAVGLAGSYTALIDDSSVLDYNPGALNTIGNYGASLLFSTWIDQTTTFYASGAGRMGDLVVGGSAFLLNYGQFLEYDSFGNEAASYNPIDFNGRGAVSFDLGKVSDAVRGLALGGGVSVVGKNGLDTVYWGGALDAGLHYSMRLSAWIGQGDDEITESLGMIPLYYGLVLQNIGLAGSGFLPLTISAGFAVGPYPDLLLTVEMSKAIQDNPWIFRFGAEYTFFEIITLRTGFSAGREQGNFSLGAGVAYPWLFQTIRLDYAFVPLGNLGNNHVVSLVGELSLQQGARDYLEKAEYYYTKRDYIKAKEMYEKTLKIDPVNRRAKEKLARAEEYIRVYELIPLEELQQQKIREAASGSMATNQTDVPTNTLNTNIYYPPSNYPGTEVIQPQSEPVPTPSPAVVPEAATTQPPSPTPTPSVPQPVTGTPQPEAAGF